MSQQATPHVFCKCLVPTWMRAIRFAFSSAIKFTVYWISCLEYQQVYRKQYREQYTFKRYFSDFDGGVFSPSFNIPWTRDAFKDSITTRKGVDFEFHKPTTNLTSKLLFAERDGCLLGDEILNEWIKHDGNRSVEI